jgi:hypothetical protein
MYHYMNLIELDILEIKRRVATMGLVRDSVFIVSVIKIPTVDMGLRFCTVDMA